MRLNKHIAETGYCSRREADRLIAEKRVTVNGKEATITPRESMQSMTFPEGIKTFEVNRNFYLDSQKMN